jgi:phytol kinase
VTDVVLGLRAGPWVGIAAALGAFLLLFAGLQVYGRAAAAEPETTRKMFHTGSGVLTLAFPFLFSETWPVLLLTGASALVVAAVKFLPPLRTRFGGVANRVERATLGELYFPVSVGLLFWLTRGEDVLLFVIPVLMLTFADATCALVGRRYGLTRYHGASKSLEGSVAFAVVAFFCVHVPLLIWSDVGRAESLLMAATLALLVMVLEGSAWRGLDNLFIPLGGYVLLRAYMPLTAGDLVPRLSVAVALVVLVVAARNRTTLEDDSLAAGVFLCYVAWAVMGWQWLVAPLAILIGYRWLSPPTPDNSRRMHGVPALLSIWTGALAWLALAGASGDRTLLLPYTVVFSAHLAIFGFSRLAFQLRHTRLVLIFWRAVLTSWAIVMVPFLVVTGVDALNLAAAIGTIGALALGAAAFLALQPHIRNTPQTGARWVCQAGAASLASVAAWGMRVLVAMAD